MGLTAEQVRTDVMYQIGALSAFAVAHGTGCDTLLRTAVGQSGRRPPDYAAAVCDAVEAIDPMIVVAQDGELADEARRRGLMVGIVGIVDGPTAETARWCRAPSRGGDPRPRGAGGPGDPDRHESTLETVDGTVLAVRADSLLLHGDNAGAVATARAIREGLTEAGVTVAPMADVLGSRG